MRGRLALFVVLTMAAVGLGIAVLVDWSGAEPDGRVEARQPAAARGGSGAPLDLESLTALIVDTAPVDLEPIVAPSLGGAPAGLLSVILRTADGSVVDASTQPVDPDQPIRADMIDPETPAFTPLPAGGEAVVRDDEQHFRQIVVVSGQTMVNVIVEPRTDAAVDPPAAAHFASDALWAWAGELDRRLSDGG